MNISLESIILAGILGAIGIAVAWVKGLQRKTQAYENEKKVKEIKDEAKTAVDEQSLESLVNGANKKHSTRTGRNH